MTVVGPRSDFETWVSLAASGLHCPTMKQCASVKASDASRRRQSRYWRARERNSQEPVNSAGLSRVAWCRCYSASAGCWDSLKFGPVSHLGLCHVVADPIAAPPRSRPLGEEGVQWVYRCRFVLSSGLRGREGRSNWKGGKKCSWEAKTS